MNLLSKFINKIKEGISTTTKKVQKQINKVIGKPISQEERKIYEELQKQSNEKVNQEYEKLNEKQKEILDKVDIVKDTDTFPINKIKDKEYYQKQIEKFNNIINSENLFEDKLIGDTKAFLDVFGKSKYSQVKDGVLYEEFKDALSNADPEIRYEFFNVNRRELTNYYQRANEFDNAYDERQLERTLKQFTKMLNGEIPITTTR